MPQVDLEALVCGLGGADARIACETQMIDAVPPDDPDLPPESIVLPVGGFHWADMAAGAVVYERYDSTKGSTNPKAQAEKRQQQQQQHAQPKPLSTSQRFSGPLQAKAHIIGLPAKIEHHSGHLGRSGRRAANAPVFPKKLQGAGGGEEPAVADEDPGSPKVSCMGKVLSTEQERNRCRRSSEEGNAPAGYWASVSAVICCSKQRPARSAEGGEREERKIETKAAMEPPGLGTMRRYASERRTVDWDVDSEEHVAQAGLFDEDASWVEHVAETTD
ncbi:hypothetical protein Cni_G21520 [Canna indica]|uniref:Uncharacterized protein n=1 Tax=Canna indica TaxID=4628 RepID=A0AAQ3KPN2_9LILI|nr:hypothetical protein Cni_G21520 [Canna indica]